MGSVAHSGSEPHRVLRKEEKGKRSIYLNE